ncbi:MAG: hypothetical protein GF329_20480 [Candidatus Lokiarchaeota archaeon]|nr:hypothetical protein [Candidatus Lokiarchaeota archaeon]
MPKCPYCEKELEIKLEIKPIEIDQDFKDAAFSATEGVIDIQADAAPFVGGMVRKMGKRVLKIVERYFNKIGAVPMIIQSCKNCNTVIDTEFYINPSSLLGFGSK